MKFRGVIVCGALFGTLALLAVSGCAPRKTAPSGVSVPVSGATDSANTSSVFASGTGSSAAAPSSSAVSDPSSAASSAPSSASSPAPAVSSYKTYVNARYGVTADYPAELVAKDGPANGDGQIFVSKDGTVEFCAFGSNNVEELSPADYFSQIILPGLSGITYKEQKSNWFIVSWKEKDSIVYEKGVVGKGSVNAFYLKYPASQKAQYDAVVTHIAASLRTPGINEYH